MRLLQISRSQVLIILYNLRGKQGVSSFLLREHFQKSSETIKYRKEKCF